MGFIFNFIKRIIKTSIKLALYLGIFATLIVFIPNLPPYTKFTTIVQTPTQARLGPLAPNNALNNVEQKYKGKLLGPEAFEVLNGELYTSLATGEIVKISPGGHITFVTKVGLPCTGLQNEHICGRPLGFQIDDKSNTLYVADAYHGIWKVDLKTDKKQLLVSPHVEIGKRLPKLFNSIALDKNGDFYWTDSSSDFHLKDGAISMLTDPSGRVFHYNAAKNESKVLIDDLWFPNGVAVSPDKEFLVITESCRYRLLKYYLSGPKKGQTEVFVDGLPGVPDNIRVLPDGSGVLVGLYTVFDDEHPLLPRSMSSTPLVRKFLARLQLLIQIPFEYLNSIYPHILFQDIVYHIGHFKSVSGLSPPSSGLVQVDWKGKIIAGYFNTDESITHISDGIVFNEKLYMGNPHLQDFIAAAPVPPLLKTAFKTVKKSEPSKVETKPQETKPKIEEKPITQQKVKKEELKKKEEAKPKVEQKPKVDEKPKVEQKPKVDEKPKVEQKPKVDEKPKVDQKPKVDEKPKVDQKPKVEEKPKVEQKSKIETKPTVETKPNVDAKKETPKTANTDNKPPQQNKPAQPAKEPQQAPKTSPPSPKTTAPPAKAELPKSTPQPQATTSKPPVKSTPASKPTEKTTPPPKPAVTTTPTPPKTTTKQPEQPKKSQDTPNLPQGKVKEPIPIKEDIPLDTVQPTKETLKVIKKGGVNTEIPVPNN